MLPHICGVPYLHVNRPLLNWAVIFMVHTIKWKLSLLQTPPLRTVSLVPNTASFIHTLPSNKGHFPAMQTLDFVSFGSLRVAYSLSDVWIDEASSDATTRKLGSDFGWLIVQSFALLCIFMSNFSATVDFPRIERLLGVKKKNGNLYRKQQNCPCLWNYDLLDWTTNEQSMVNAESR